VEYAGRNGSRVLFVKDNFGAIVDEKTNSVVQVGNKKALVASLDWNAYGKKPEGTVVELANAAMTDLDIRVFANNDRMYTIPDAVVAEAKRGLEWRKEENRGGTPVGLNTARTLARGGQIGIRKVRHIAKYFPRHEVDKNLDKIITHQMGVLHGLFGVEMPQNAGHQQLLIEKIKRRQILLSLLVLECMTMRQWTELITTHLCHQRWNQNSLFVSV
jgi:hypothetical protein